MIKRDELTNPDSCLNRAADDEPVFVLRAHDESAPERVRSWAIRYTQRKRMQGMRELTKREQRKIDQTYALADQMETWRETHCGSCLQLYTAGPDVCCDNPTRMRNS